jgi:hypothetical protein
MTAQNVLEAISKVPGVRQAFIAEPALIEEVFRREESVEDTSFGMPLDNRALQACRERSGHIIVVCDYAFEQPTEHVMIMEDDTGGLIGFDIPPGRIGEFEDRTDLIWLSDDFVLSMDADYDVAKVVMLPQSVNCVCSADGAADPVVMYPATTTDMYIREQLCIDADSADIATAVLSFNPA